MIQVLNYLVFAKLSEIESFLFVVCRARRRLHTAQTTRGTAGRCDTPNPRCISQYNKNNAIYIANSSSLSSSLLRISLLFFRTTTFLLVGCFLFACGAAATTLERMSRSSMS